MTAEEPGRRARRSHINRAAAQAARWRAEADPDDLDDPATAHLQTREGGDALVTRLAYEWGGGASGSDLSDPDDLAVKAAALHLAGENDATIAARLGYATPRAAHRAARLGIARLEGVVADDAETVMRAAVIRRLERLEQLERIAADSDASDAARVSAIRAAEGVDNALLALMGMAAPEAVDSDGDGLADRGAAVEAAVARWLQAQPPVAVALERAAG